MLNETASKTMLGEKGVINREKKKTNNKTNPLKNIKIFRLFEEQVTQ